MIMVAPGAGLLLSVLSTALPAVQQDRSCADAVAWGAVGDGQHNDTSALQAAIDSCAARRQALVLGGLRSYRISSLTFRSNLSLEAGSTLRADNNTALWPQVGDGTRRRWRSILVGYGSNNVTLDGGGLVDGQGHVWWDLAHSEMKKRPPVRTDSTRPRMVVCYGCTKFALRGLQLLNSPSYHVELSGRDCEVSGVKIRSPRFSIAPNTDGIDIACVGGYIANNHVVNGDDSLCVKSPCSDLLFENNYAEQGNGIVIGTSNDVNISNITYRNTVLNRTAYGTHIKFKEVQTGHVRDVVFENITVIAPYRYVMGINQNNQGRRRFRRLTSQDQPFANVSIVDISYRNIRTLGSKVMRAGLFECHIERQCSECGPIGPPCTGITMENISIDALHGCEYDGAVSGKSMGRVVPADCIPPRTGARMKTWNDSPER